MSNSKPSLNFVDPNLNVKDNKNIININTQGIVEQKGGKIYMTHSFMASTSTTLTEGDVVSSTSVSTTTNEECCESAVLVTGVTVTDTTTRALTNVAVADVKEDIFLPIMCTDSSNNLQEVIRSVTQEDNNSPEQFRNPMIDEEIMY
tara:strand:+ start:6633 stop:7073 length:441 start_codon:yes stop_codon:yes gene_type:complete